MGGHFSDKALANYNQLVGELQGADFAEGETYDFTRCVRPNGTVYGTKGTCRKGTEVGEKEKAESYKPYKDFSYEDLKLQREFVAGALKRVSKVKLSKREQHKLNIEEELRLMDEELARKRPDPLLAKMPLQQLHGMINDLDQRRSKLGDGIVNYKIKKINNELERRKSEKADVVADVSKILGAKEVKSVDSKTVATRESAKQFDDNMGPSKREGDKEYTGWDGSYGSGAQRIGRGSFGLVVKNSDGTFVKRGDISDKEADLIRRVEEKDLGPKLVAADIDGPPKGDKVPGYSMRTGRIAMSEVPGKTMGLAEPDKKWGGRVNTADIYWKAMADLHRMGIAHNDAHPNNLIIDDAGKGRWVDFGFGQASPKAALAEAMGVFYGTGQGGNWQTRGFKGTGVKVAEEAFSPGGTDSKEWKQFKATYPVVSRVWENIKAAEDKLIELGLKKRELRDIGTQGIRSPLESFDKGVWGKLTDQQAQEILDTLYNGI
jgi:hypothetical protein